MATEFILCYPGVPSEWHVKPEDMTSSDYLTEDYYALLNALRDRPELPPPLVLQILSYCGTWPEDWEEGKRIQAERGLETVPPKTECEIGAGWWHRVIRRVP